MKHTIIKLTLIGLVIGMAVGNLIAIITSIPSGEVLAFSDRLLELTGSAAAALSLQTLGSGVIGAFAMAGVALYQLDSLGMIWTALIHYSMIIAIYFPIAILLGWLEPNVHTICIMALIQAACYAVVWLIMYARYRLEVRELNGLLNER